MTEEIFFQKPQEATLAISIVILIISTLSLCIPAVQLIDDTPSAGILLGLVGLVFAGLGVSFVRKKTGSKSYIKLTDDGLDLNGTLFIKWSDIAELEEGMVDETDSKYFTVKQKALHIKYVDNTKNVLRIAAITEDYEGYQYICSRIDTLVKQAQG